MTAHANVLTKSAAIAESRPPLPTQAASQVRAFVDALGRLGYETHTVLRSAGVQLSDLEDPDGRISCAAVNALFARAMQERPIKNLGMRIAAETPIGAFPLVDYLVLTSACVGEGLTQLARYFRIVGVPVGLKLKETPDSVHAIYEGPADRFGDEFGITLNLLHLLEETEGRFRAEYASFTHTPDDVSEIERVLRCPVRAGASWNGWVMSRATWNLPFRRRDPILRELLERQANEMMRRIPELGGTALEVRQALVSRVAGGDTRIGGVARTLAMSARSLQRQLAAEGYSYQSLVDASRKEAAERYLSDSSLPIGEVAYLLGYSEAAAFHRAFKRWNGITPAAFRHGLHSRQ